MLISGYRTFGITKGNGNREGYEPCLNCGRKSNYDFTNSGYSTQTKASHLGDYSGNSSKSYRRAG